LSRDRAARALPADRGGGPVQDPRRCGPRLADRRTGVHQYPRQLAAFPIQGHDLAAGVLRWIVHAGSVRNGGAVAGGDPPQPVPYARTLRLARRARAERAASGRATMSGASRHYVLAAGGTGGHLIPAFALAQELDRRGHHVALITDARGAAIPGKPDFLTAHVLPAGRFGKNPLKWPAAIAAVLEGR